MLPWAPIPLHRRHAHVLLHGLLHAPLRLHGWLLRWLGLQGGAHLGLQGHHGVGGHHRLQRVAQVLRIVAAYHYDVHSAAVLWLSMCA